MRRSYPPQRGSPQAQKRLYLRMSGNTQRADLVTSTHQQHWGVGRSVVAQLLVCRSPIGRVGSINSRFPDEPWRTQNSDMWPQCSGVSLSSCLENTHRSTRTLPPSAASFCSLYSNPSNSEDIFTLRGTSERVRSDSLCVLCVSDCYSRLSQHM